MTNNRPLIAHLSMFFASAFWGLMAPLGKDAMTHGLTGIQGNRRRIALLVHILFPAQRACTQERLAHVCRCSHIRAGHQPVLLHHRPEHHFSHQCQHCHHLNANICHDSCSHHPQRAHHRQESLGCLLGVQRCCHPDTHQCSSLQCRSWRPSWRPALHVRTALVRLVSVDVQPTHQTLFSVHGQQVDVYLCHLAHIALHLWACSSHRLCQRARQDLAGDRICGILRHLHQLHTNDDRPAHPAPHSGQYIQLCATIGIGNGHHPHRHRCIQVQPGPCRHSGLPRSMARYQVEVESGHGKIQGLNHCTMTSL